MTDGHRDRRGDGSADLPVDLLADLDAGLLEPTTAARLRAAAAQDARASAVLAGLAATRGELGALTDPPVPEEFAVRWDAALAAVGAATPPAASRHASATGLPVGSPSPPAPRVGRARFHGRRRRAPVALATMALTAAVVAGVFVAPSQRDPLSLDRVDLVAAGLAVRGDFDVGELADPARRLACLRSVAPPGVAPDARLLGGRAVVVDGRRGVLLLLAAGPPRPGVHIVVVDPRCGPDGGSLLGAQTVGG